MSKVFSNTISQTDSHNALLQSFGAKLSPEEMEKLNRIKRNWNFWEGFHWEDMPDSDKPQVTENYVRAFVDKFVAFELGNGFHIKMKPNVESAKREDDPLDFLNFVWDKNNQLAKCVELGQSKAVTGDGWIQVGFDGKYMDDGKTINPEFYDPFGEYEKGKVRINVVPTSIVFPEYSDLHDKDLMNKLVIKYPINISKQGVFGKVKPQTVIYRQEWTKDTIKVYQGEELITDMKNKYGIIPFVQIKNYPHQGRNEGVSDIEDIIPLNMELNLKKSDISEIIDYHSAPVTIVFGARIGQLERGANKVWGGLPKDAKVENLRLEGDLTAAQNYTTELKKAMHEVGNIPMGVLGGDLSISNTSGVALQISLKPILDRVKIKQVMTKEGLELVNKIILLIGEMEGLVEIPAGVNRQDFFYNEVTFDSALPKDSLLELQEIELEMRMGLESREGAMIRTGKDNIAKKTAEIDKDMEENPSLYGKDDIQEQILLMKEQSKISKDGNTPKVPTSTTKKVGTNSEGKPKEVNAGFQNSPIPKK